MNNNAKVLMIGPDRNALGGMSSVIKLYYESNLLNNNTIFLSSYKEGSILYKIIFFAFFLIQYFALLLFEKNIKIIHLHMATKGSFFRKAIIVCITKPFNKKIIMHVHASELNIFYAQVPFVIKRFITKILDICNLIIALSDQCKKDIAQKTSNTNIIVLYNPTILKELNHIHSSKINNLFMGQLGRRKGTYEIIEAAKYIKNPNVIISLYGDGNIDEFKKLVIDNNLQDKIIINGWISGDKKEDVFSNSDILLLPSYNEGLPISILEAMAYGLPIITTPVGGIPEAVEEGVNGFLIQPGDYVALAEKIDILAADNQLREKMGQESYKLAKEKFDIKIIMQQLQEIYKELL